jgi:hypothetical protein
VFDRNILNNRNIYAATDAVVNPANGQIVCRSTLNGLDPGCTPINPFGTGAINAATAAYVTGDSWRYLKLTQDVAAVNVQGSLPDWVALWSKPASLAVGAEWRRETANQTSDAVSQATNNFAGLRGAASSQSGTLGGFYASNPQPISGRVTVKELYGELALPVAVDRPFIKALDLNAAVPHRLQHQRAGGDLEAGRCVEAGAGPYLAPDTLARHSRAQHSGAVFRRCGRQCHSDRSQDRRHRALPRLYAR